MTLVLKFNKLTTHKITTCMQYTIIYFIWVVLFVGVPMCDIGTKMFKLSHQLLLKHVKFIKFINFFLTNAIHLSRKSLSRRIQQFCV